MTYRLMIDRFIPGDVTHVVGFECITEQGEFKTELIQEGQDWDFSQDVLYKDGNIYWRTIRPAGMLIKYKDGTKRFISENWLL